MTQPQPLPEPPSVAMDVENWVNTRFAKAEKYSNCEVLDEDGVYTLHQIAAHIYALGFADGVGVQHVRDSGERIRRQDTERAAAATNAEPSGG